MTRVLPPLPPTNQYIECSCEPAYEAHEMTAYANSALEAEYHWEDDCKSAESALEQMTAAFNDVCDELDSLKKDAELWRLFLANRDGISTNVLMMGTNDELTEEIRIAAAPKLAGEGNAKDPD